MARTPVGAGVLGVVLGEVGEEIPEAPLLEEADQGGQQRLVQRGGHLFLLFVVHVVGVCVEGRCPAVAQEGRIACLSEQGPSLCRIPCRCGRP